MDLLSPMDLSRYLGVPETSLAQWRHFGKGPAFVKVGRHVRYRPEAVEEWIASQTRGQKLTIVKEAQ